MERISERLDVPTPLFPIMTIEARLFLCAGREICSKASCGVGPDLGVEHRAVSMLWLAVLGVSKVAELCYAFDHTSAARCTEE